MHLSNNSELFLKPSWLRTYLKKQIPIIWSLGYMNYARSNSRLNNWDNKAFRTAMKKMRVFSYWNQPFIFEVIELEWINYYYDNLLASLFKIQKTYKFLNQKYFLLNFWCDINLYIKGYDVYLTYKVVCHKSCGYL